MGFIRYPNMIKLYYKRLMSIIIYLFCRGNCMGTLTKIYTRDLTKDSIWIFNTPSEAAKSFLLYVQELGFFKARAKYHTSQENISSYLIMLTIAGRGEYRDPSNAFPLKAGRLVFVDSMAPHTHYTSKGANEPWEILWVQFSGYAARGYFTQYKTKSLPYLDIQSNPKSGPCLKNW